MTIAVAIVDLQFGSTGKGSLAAYLGEHGYYNRGSGETIRFTAAATNWGPNAGHTSVYPDGEKCVRTMLSNALHRGTPMRQYVGPGSAINFEALELELHNTLNLYAQSKGNVDIFIHEHAAVVRPKDREAEKRHNRIGSTQKGTAEAWVAKMNRDDTDDGCIAAHYVGLYDNRLPHIKIIKHAEYIDRLYNEPAVLLEGCQGYSLGFSSGFWPHVTARECTVAQLLADTCIGPDQLFATIGTARTFPIRVANRMKDGEMVGWSGPGYPDQREIQFSDIGQPVEYTTVTKLPRRIFTFSWMQFLQGVNVNGCDEVFINFLNYLPTEDDQNEFVTDCNRHLSSGGNGSRIGFLGLGASIDDIIRV